jgi:hypothetical protein
VALKGKIKSGYCLAGVDDDVLEIIVDSTGIMFIEAIKE